MTYEVRRIVRDGETVVGIFGQLTAAFDSCVKLWEARKPGQPVYAVRDAETEQRWSYADIKDLRAGTAIPCDGCNGTGVHSSGDQCVGCKGSGRWWMPGSRGESPK